jgi:hypothetical protein
MDSLFGGTKQQPPAAPGANTQVTQQNASSGEQPVSGQLEKSNNQQTDPTKKQAANNPLDPYKELWQDSNTPAANGGNPAPDNSNPQKQQQQQPASHADIAKKINFSQILNPEIVTKALSGDTAAFSQVINQISQASFAASGKYAEQLIAKAVKDSEGRIGSSLPEKFKAFSLQNSTLPSKALNHPAVRPMVDAIKQQFMHKFPDATTKEIEDHANSYVSSMFEALESERNEVQSQSNSGNSSGRGSAEVTDRIKKQETGEFDWSKEYLGVG